MIDFEQLLDDVLHARLLMEAEAECATEPGLYGQLEADYDANRELVLATYAAKDQRIAELAAALDDHAFHRHAMEGRSDEAHCGCCRRATERVTELEETARKAWRLLMCMHPRDRGLDATVKAARAVLLAAVESQ